MVRFTQGTNKSVKEIKDLAFQAVKKITPKIKKPRNYA